MAPVRLLDTPGYFIITNANAVIPDEYKDLKADRYYDFKESKNCSDEN